MLLNLEASFLYRLIRIKAWSQLLLAEMDSISVVHFVSELCSKLQCQIVWKFPSISQRILTDIRIITYARTMRISIIILKGLLMEKYNSFSDQATAMARKKTYGLKKSSALCTMQCRVKILIIYLFRMVNPNSKCTLRGRKLCLRLLDQLESLWKSASTITPSLLGLKYIWFQHSITLKY